jgi:hypothetical protein
MANDYPFTNWTGYFKTLLEVFSTELYGETYPLYEHFCQDKGFDGDVEIMTELLERSPSQEWAQEGLNGLVDTMIKGPRYSYEYVSHFEPVIKKMLDRGAVIDVNRVLTPHLSVAEREKPYGFETESQGFNIRGKLLAMFVTYGVELPAVITDADPVYWEDLLDWDTKCQMGDFMKAFYSGVKYCMAPPTVICETSAHQNDETY